MKLITHLGIALAATAITGFAGVADAASIPVTNAGFEYPVLGDVSPPGNLLVTLDGSDASVGWVKTGNGQIYNPGDNANAPEGSNSYLILDGVSATYDQGSGSILQQLTDVLSEGAYTLTVKVGENATAASSFATGGYSVDFGVIEGGVFVPLDSESSLTPSNGFLTSTVMYAAGAGDIHIGSPLAIQLTGNVTAGSNNQVLFDDVNLDFVAAPGDRDVYLKVQPFDKVLPSGGTVAMWGFASCDDTFTTCSAPSETDAPGPRIDAYAGFSLRIHVLNTLALPVSINIPGQSNEVGRAPVMMGTAPDRVQSFTHETPTGATATDAVTYEWSSLKAGTFLYQSGTMPSLQVPMGLYGALVVNEGTGGTAYGNAFDTEALLVLSEVDPVQNARVADAETSATPVPDTSCVPLAEYELHMTAGYPCAVDYSPRYFFVNGGASAVLPAGDPSGDPAVPTPVLLRLANAGLRTHTPAIVGVELGLIAEDGNAYPIQRDQSAAMLSAGKTLDAIVNLPKENISFNIFDRMPPFANDNEPAGGGSLVTVQVGTGTPPVVAPASPAQDDSYAVTEDTALVVAAVDGVLSNDDPALMSAASAAAVSGPEHGTLAFVADGGFTYTPNADFSGRDSFTYSASDGGGNTFGARVMLNVSFENDAPVGANDAYTNNVNDAGGTGVIVLAPGVLGNDSDADGDQLYALQTGGTATLSTDGSFTAAADDTITYVACDQIDAATPPACTGLQSAETTVTVTVNARSNIALNVVDPSTGGTVSDYRWTLQVDNMFHPDPDNPGAEESLATTFHRSYMPVVAQGCVGPTACSDGEAETPFNDAYLNPDLHYYVTVLPADAMSEAFVAGSTTETRAVGHTIGARPIPANLPPAFVRPNPVTVEVHPEPLQYAQIRVKIFNDNAPTNAAFDAGEEGLGGFEITLEDGGGRYGMAAGLLSQDADGNPLRNALDCFDTDPPAGIIVTCPDTPANQALDIVGEALITHLFPGKYGVITTPPTTGWVETSTIEGTKVIDAWVKSGEPQYFTEFGPPGWHVATGFVNPDAINAIALGGGATISGAVTNNHMSRPPVQTLFDSQTYDALAHTRPWIALNSAAGTGPTVAVVHADLNDDGTATFAIPEVPPGAYQLAIWDDYLDQVIAYRSVDVAAGATSIDVGNIPVFNWFARLEHWVYLDVNENGIRDGVDEVGIPEQAVNVRWRDGTMYQSFPTDGEGFVPFDQMFPFFHWLVAEVDFTRFKATGVTVTVDGGGDVSATGNVLNPQQQIDSDCVGAAPCFSRTETGPALLEGFQAFLGQTNVFEWGKKPYAVGENGGISGVVYYAVTRAENDPRLAAAEPWEPGIPGATVRLYRQVMTAPTSIAVENASFEIPVGGDGVLDSTVDGTNGWVKTGGGQIYNPGLDANAPDGFNSYLILNSISGYDLGSGSVQQVLADVLSEGTYTLTVQVGENATTTSVFGHYQVQLGVFDGSNFVLLAEDNDSLAPSNGFLTSTVEYTAAVDDVNIGNNLMIRLVGDVSGAGNIQVLFDDVQLTFSDAALALVAETQTDSWDDSLPTGCPGADPIDMQIVGPDQDQDPTDTLTTKCYDGLRNFNQVRSAVFDGGYAFGADPAAPVGDPMHPLPPGKYVVEVVPPAGYELLKEEDVNVWAGDRFATPPLPAPGGAVIPVLPPYEAVAAAMAPEPGIAQPPCVGEMREVPDKMSLFPAANEEAPFRRSLRPLCNRKAVILSDQGQAAADFMLITDAPIAAQAVGMVLLDTAQEFNPLSPQFGEKWAPPYVPISIRDWTGREISRKYSDQWGRYDLMLPSTFSASMPSPSGFSPSMLMACMNDPGPVLIGGSLQVDPKYNAAFSNFCYTFQFMPGATTYLDTPVLPVSAFASGYNPVDCALVDATPVIYSVDGDGAGIGPLATAGGTLTITSMGTAVEVPNPAYEGPGATAAGATSKTVTRDYGFGAQGPGSQVTIGGVPLTITSWMPDTIEATVTNPDGLAIATGQLVVTRDGGNSTEYAVTVTVSSETPIVVGPTDSIQDAIDAAAPGALILVEPGVYNESVIMYKPVRLQGAGAGSTLINAVKRPTEAIAQWRVDMDCVFGIGAGCTRQADALPTQPDGAAAFDVSEGAGITVLGLFDPGAGPGNPPRPAVSFRRQPARIDGFGITGADVGGGILLNSNAHNTEVSNNHVFGNNGSFNGGIRIGEPYLQIAAPADGTYAFNENVNIHDNAIDQNGGLEGVGGGVSISVGSDNYFVTNNQVCGNFTLGDGGGIGHVGLSDNGHIGGNRILFNQSFNQGVTVSGGGVFVAGETPAAGALTLGSGTVHILDNLIQGNQAGGGSGGGLRSQYVNGQDVLDALEGGGPPGPRVSRWYLLEVVGNKIVNNNAARDGGGISLQDTARSVLRDNTIAHNDSTATIGGLIVGNLSTPQPAGIATELHSAELAAAIPVHAQTDGLREFSNPQGLTSNAIVENRAFYYDGTGTYPQPMLVPVLAQATVGQCVTTDVTYWDLDPLLPGGTIGTTTTSAADPGFDSPFCNGGRTLATTPGPMFALPALDEGGNAWVEVRFGPLTRAWPVGSAPWSYAVP